MPAPFIFLVIFTAVAASVINGRLALAQPECSSAVTANSAIVADGFETDGAIANALVGEWTTWDSSRETRLTLRPNGRFTDCTPAS